MQSIQEKDLAALHTRIKTLERQVEQPVAPSDDTLRDLASTLQERVAELGDKVTELQEVNAELAELNAKQKIIVAEQTKKLEELDDWHPHPSLQGGE